VLDDALREAVILTIAAEVSCLYEWTHHYPIALKAGCSPELLADIEASRTGDEAPPLGPALRLARALVEPTPPAIELVREVQGHLGDRGLVDLVVTATYYGMVGRAMNALRVPLEDDVPRV
jgi:4-carboxymuconolactone decarboxylase